jgi:hypothetical protein
MHNSIAWISYVTTHFRSWLIQLHCLLMYRCVSPVQWHCQSNYFEFSKGQEYIVGNSEPRENIGVLNELIDARDELAKVSRFLYIVKFHGFIIQIS